jgi:hypothetical protein
MRSLLGRTRLERGEYSATVISVALLRQTLAMFGERLCSESAQLGGLRVADAQSPPSE